MSQPKNLDSFKFRCFGTYNLLVFNMDKNLRIGWFEFINFYLQEYQKYDWLPSYTF